MKFYLNYIYYKIFVLEKVVEIDYFIYQIVMSEKVVDTMLFASFENEIVSNN